jgi:hypothetical protein
MLHIVHVVTRDECDKERDCADASKNEQMRCAAQSRVELARDLLKAVRDTADLAEKRLSARLTSPKAR